MSCDCQNIRHPGTPARCKNRATRKCRVCFTLLCAACSTRHHAHSDFEKIPLTDSLFNLEEINGGNRCPTYLYRWTLLRIKSWAMYLHHFVGDDWARDLHDHPKRFISIGLWGRYVEQTPTSERVYQAPWVRTFPATHIHRLRLINKEPCWTLVIVLNTVRPWGFWHEGRFINWKSYVFGKDAAIGDRMRSC